MKFYFAFQLLKQLQVVDVNNHVQQQTQRNYVIIYKMPCLLKFYFSCKGLLYAKCHYFSKNPIIHKLIIINCLTSKWLM